MARDRRGLRKQMYARFNPRRLSASICAQGTLLAASISPTDSTPGTGLADDALVLHHLGRRPPHSGGVQAGARDSRTHLLDSGENLPAPVAFSHKKSLVAQARLGESVRRNTKSFFRKLLREMWTNPLHLLGFCSMCKATAATSSKVIWHGHRLWPRVCDTTMRGRLGCWTSSQSLHLGRAQALAKLSGRKGYRLGTPSLFGTHCRAMQASDK